MKKKIIIVLSLICLLLLVFCIMNYMQYKDAKSNNIKLKNEIIKKENEIQSIDESNISLKSEYEKLEKEKKEIVSRYKNWEEKNKKILEYLQ